MQKKTFAVIGLGTFGSEVAKELISLNQEVICIDKSEENVIKMSQYAQHAVVCDATDEISLREIGIDSVDHAIVAVGEYDQTMVLSTLIIKDMGVPKVTVKVKDEKQQRVMQMVGADEVVFPERLMARKLAQRISARNIVDITKLSDEFSYVEFEVPQSFIGRSLDQIDFRRNYKLNVVAVKRGEQIGLANPYEPFQEHDIMIIVGFNKEIENFDKRIEERKI